MNTRIPVLSRRALMSALGVSGFAVLLSACEEDAKPAGTSVESPRSSSAEGAEVYGPAQNVPKPKTEEGYTNASLDGMTKSVKAWTEWRNYGLQTGDFKEAMKFVDKQYTDELELYQNTSRFYKDGGWIVGGDLHQYEFHGEPINQGNGKYEWKYLLLWPYRIYIAADGRVNKVYNDDYENNWYMMTLHHDGNRWFIDGTRFLNVQGNK